MSTFSDTYKEYLDYCQNFLRRSPVTIKGMASSYRVFLQYFPDNEITSYTLEDIYSYCEWLSERPGRNGHYSASALCQRIGQVKKLFEWADERGYKVLNWRHIKVPRNTSRRMDYLTSEELVKVLKKVKTNTFEGIRLKACLEVLASTGCRASELLNMTMDDIDLESGEIFIPHGKGNQLGVVFLSTKAKHYLEQYLKERGKHGKCKWVWVSVRGQCCPLSISSLQHQLSVHQKNIKFHKHLHPHMFRHTFATNLLRNGANIREVQELMRHKSLESTMVYTHVTNKDLKRVHDRCLNYN